jgi:hypothetical protein
MDCSPKSAAAYYPTFPPQQPRGRPTMRTPMGHDAGMEATAYEGVDARPSPRFYKLEFATYDGSEDPLNWLNHCEQFFRGQRTPASDRTWLASYHLKGPAQTWYYALEHDEGMPPWDRFAKLCRLRFGPPVRGSRIAELGRLPFLSTVQEYSDRFLALLCRARDISPLQKTELYVGGLLEHLRVDVEMRAPQDLQTAMYLARAFERRATAMPPPQPRGARPPQRSQPPRRALPAAPAASLANAAVAGEGNPPMRQFRRLTPAEQQERRRQGLCFNCDEPYVPGHMCQRLFYLEVDDFIDDAVGEGAVEQNVGFLEAPVVADTAGANTLVVSLHALAGIRIDKTLLLSVITKGERQPTISSMGTRCVASGYLWRVVNTSGLR